MAVAGSLGGQSEVEAMARLGLVFIHHANGVNELQEPTRKKKEKKRKQKKKRRNKKTE